MSKTKRLFIALPIAPDWTEKFETYKSSWGESWVKWTAAEEFHITVLFLGDVDEELIPEISSALLDVAGITKPLTLKFDGASYAPEEKSKPSMLWARFADDAAFLQLAGQVREEITYVLGKIDALPTLTHMTLAKFSGNSPETESLPVIPKEGSEGEILHFSEMQLIESIPREGSHHYRIIDKFIFRGE